jgi:hypothetical protein
MSEAPEEGEETGTETEAVRGRDLGAAAAGLLGPVADPEELDPAKEEVLVEEPEGPEEVGAKGRTAGLDGARSANMSSRSAVVMGLAGEADTAGLGAAVADEEGEVKELLVVLVVVEDDEAEAGAEAMGRMLGFVGARSASMSSSSAILEALELGAPPDGLGPAAAGPVVTEGRGGAGAVVVVVVVVVVVETAGL